MKSVIHIFINNLNLLLDRDVDKATLYLYNEINAKRSLLFA